MKTELNKSSKSVVAVYSIIIFVYVLVFLVIPFPKNASSWISFAFTVISVIASFGITVYAFKDKETLVSKIYGFPVFRIGYLYAIVQFIGGVLICSVAAFLPVPYWVALIFSVIIAGAAAIGVIATDSTRDAVEEIEEEEERVTKAIKIFKLDISSIMDCCEDECLRKDLENLAEEIRFSDPVSSDETEEAENNLNEEINNLKIMINYKNYDKASAQIKKVKNLLAERNRICKAFK